MLEKTVRGYAVSAYVISDMPLINMCTAFEISMVFYGEKEPSKELVEALVDSHMRNVRLLCAEVTEVEIPKSLVNGH